MCGGNNSSSSSSSNNSSNSSNSSLEGRKKWRERGREGKRKREREGRCFKSPWKWQQHRKTLLPFWMIFLHSTSTFAIRAILCSDETNFSQWNPSREKQNLTKDHFRGRSHWFGSKLGVNCLFKRANRGRRGRTRTGGGGGKAIPGKVRLRWWLHWTNWNAAAAAWAASAAQGSNGKGRKWIWSKTSLTSGGSSSGSNNVLGSICIKNTQRAQHEPNNKPFAAEVLSDQLAPTPFRSKTISRCDLIKEASFDNWLVFTSPFREYSDCVRLKNTSLRPSPTPSLEKELLNSIKKRKKFFFWFKKREALKHFHTPITKQSDTSAPNETIVCSASKLAMKTFSHRYRSHALMSACKTAESPFI